MIALLTLRWMPICPESYIPDAAGRIEAYKKIAAITTRDDATDVLDELIDRYGDPPRSVQGLVDISPCA